MSARRRYALAAVIAAAAAAVPLVASPAPAAHAAPDAKTAFTFTDARIDSSAGLAVLGDEPDYVFTINNHAPSRIFGVNPTTGQSTVTMRLQDARSIDWEAIAPGQGRTLWVADNGDLSGSTKSSVIVYRFELPSQPSTGFYSSTSYKLTYPDGSHDAQALLVNPTDGTVYVATHDSGGGGLYAANDLSHGGTQLRKVGSVPANVTDGAYSPDGKQFVLRTPGKAYVYSTPGKQVGTIALPQQRQGKGIAYTANGKALLLSGAGANSNVLRMKVSGALVTSSSSPTASPGSSASPTDSSGSGSDDGGGLANLAFIIGPFVIAAIAVVLALLLRKRTSGYEGGHGGGSGARDYRRYERDEPYPPPPYGERNGAQPPHEQPFDPRYQPAYDRQGDPSRPDGGGGGRAAGPRRSAGRPRRPRRGKGDDSVPFWLQE